MRKSTTYRVTVARLLLLVQDRLVRLGQGTTAFTAPRIVTRHTHGTGCTLSSAIATFLGMGLDVPEAVDKARAFVRAALLAAPGFGAGSGPLGHRAVPLSTSAGRTP